MEHEPEDPQIETDVAEQESAPPFDPDPRLVTYLEGGKRDAEARFRKEMERR